MGLGRFDSDVVVIGGGPGGSAAAITCALMGLRVRLLERQAFPAHRPGETLHPGVESVLAQLGVAERLPAVTGSRHAGIRIRWGGEERYERYGHDENGPWRGFQVWRADFDAMLLDRARELGVEIQQPAAARRILLDNNCVVGIQSTDGLMTAPIVIDASGRSHSLEAEFGLGRDSYSPSLVARYGYAAGSLPELDAAPLLIGNATGWSWSAMVRPGLYQWTEVSFDGTKHRRDWRPVRFRCLVPHGPPRAADVTWRMTRLVAQPGWFQVGDAAAVLDPTSANGVLRALLSGIMSGKLSSAVVKKSIPAVEAASVYAAWLSDWFATTAVQLARFYESLGVGGFADTEKVSRSPSGEVQHERGFRQDHRLLIPN